MCFWTLLAPCEVHLLSNENMLSDLLKCFLDREPGVFLICIKSLGRVCITVSNDNDDDGDVESCTNVHVILLLAILTMNQLNRGSKQWVAFDTKTAAYKWLQRAWQQQLCFSPWAAMQHVTQACWEGGTACLLLNTQNSSEQTFSRVELTWIDLETIERLTFFPPPKV